MKMEKNANFDSADSKDLQQEHIRNLPVDGKIVDVIEGKRRFSRVYIDDIGYAYQQNKKRTEDEIVIRCRDKKCPGIGIYFPETKILHRIGKHNHDIQKDEIDVARFLDRVKTRAEDEWTNLRLIYNQEAEHFKASILPDFSKIKSTLNKRRNAAGKPGKSNTEPEQDHLYSRKSAAVEHKLLATHYIVHKGMEIIEGAKRHSKIYVDEYKHCYQINRRKPDGSSFLRCHKSGCKGSGVYQADINIFKKLEKHNHFPDIQMITKWRFLHRLKHRAETEATPFKVIYDEEYLKESNCDLPPFNKIRSTLEKRRQLFDLSETSVPNDSTICIQVNSLRQPTDNEHSSASVCAPLDPVMKQIKPEVIDKSTSRKRIKLSQPAVHNSTQEGKRPCRKRSTTHTSTIEVIEGQKRFSKIYIDESSYMYKVHKKKADGNLALRCYEQYCAAHGTFYCQSKQLIWTGHHQHPVNTRLVEKLRFLNRLKVRAESERTLLRDIYDEEVLCYPNADIPKFNQLESTLHKRRKAHLPSEPTSLHDLEQMLTQMQLADTSHMFRSILEVDGGSRVFLFTSRVTLDDEVSKCKQIHIDTGLKMYPHLFNGLLVVSLVMEDYIFPFIYALMTHKSEHSYVSIVQWIRELYASLEPDMISTDFDPRLHEVLKVYFSGPTIEGCWFHIVQTLWTEARSLRLSHALFQDVKATQVFQCIIALSLLPTALLPQAIHTLNNQIYQCEFLSTETYKNLHYIVKHVHECWSEALEKQFCRRNLKVSYMLEATHHLFIKKIGLRIDNAVKFIDKLAQTDALLTSNLHLSKSCNNLKLFSLRKINDNIKWVESSRDMLRHGMCSIEEFLVRVATALPKLDQHENIADLEDSLVAEDPSDIPSCLSFCEININAAPEIESVPDNVVSSFEQSCSNFIKD